MIASNVAVKRRLLRGTAELDNDGSYFLHEVGMANDRDTQIGIELPQVLLAYRNNVNSIERGNKRSGNPVNSGGLGGQAHLRRLAKKTGGEKEWGEPSLHSVPVGIVASIGL